jgi:hypothetical protein
MKVEINERNWRKFKKSNLLPNKDGTKPTSNQADAEFKTNNKLLDNFKAMYDSLVDIKLGINRNIRYTFGDQLSDRIPNPDGDGFITERQYMINQGMIPLEMNVIRKMVKALVGVYRQDRLEPVAIARTRDEQKLGEMMSIAMQYAYQSNNLYETNARGYEYFLNSALVCYRTGFDWYADRKISDVVIEQCDIERMAWDDNTSGKYFENISTIGYLHDMTFGQVLSRFAKSREQKDRISEIYKMAAKEKKSSMQQFKNDDSRKQAINFYEATSPDKCRVIEIWSKEEYDAYICHDEVTGEYFAIDVDDIDKVKAENEYRVAKMIELGGSAEDAALIEYEYKVDEEWVVRYLTPNGYVLYQSVTPYAHGSHPFTIGAYPLINGEIHSMVGDTLNVQRMINRLIMRIEFSRMNDAKGFALVKKKLLAESGIGIDEFLKQWSSAKGAIAMDWDGNEDPIRVYNGTSNSSGDVQMLSTYFSLMDEITGVHGALRGEKTNSGTPASLYAQQTQNANNNIADGQDWYNGLILLRDTKMMMVIQQYYQGKRFINIAGKDYSEESKWYDSDKIRNTMFDLSLSQSQSGGVTRMQNENLLFELLKSGAIDPIVYLESTSAPFADKLLERIKTRQEQLAKEQAEQHQAMQQQAIEQQAQQSMSNPQVA